MNQSTNEPIMTREQMAGILNADRERVTTARRALETAQEQYALQTRRVNFISDEMHALALTEYLPDLREAETTARRVAEAAERNAREIRRQASLTVLARDADETARAATLLPLVQHETANVALPELVDRVRAAIAREDRPAQYLYAELVPARLQGDDPRPESREGQAARELRRMLDQIRQALRDTRFDVIMQGTDAALKESGELRTRALARRRNDPNDPDPTIPRFGSRDKVPWPVAP
jgi:hypothetical protein